MHRIVYVDGELADHLGKQYLQELAAKLATDAKVTAVDILTHGESKYHVNSRVTGTPAKAKD